MSDVVTADDLKMLDVKANDMIANEVEGEARPRDVMSPSRDSVMPELRMCWHTSGGRLNSGWRCGATTGISNAQWERVILSAQ